jgi:NAD(P)-dependent dehydrogenase (short-subunit alcohol dehydrogenase family)
MGCRWLHGGVAPELAPFGVKVCALEPGGMRTNWGKRATAGIPELLPDYEASVGTFIKMLQGHWGHEMSAPEKVAQVILQLASKEQLPAHLLLGSDAVQYARLAEEKRESDAKAWHDISVSTDAENAKELPDLKF